MEHGGECLLEMNVQKPRMAVGMLFSIVTVVSDTLADPRFQADYICLALTVLLCPIHHHE